MEIIRILRKLIDSSPNNFRETINHFVMRIFLSQI